MPKVRSFALSVVGRDRPGIVAALTKVLLEQQINIEDSRMVILRGRLAMTLIIGAPGAVEEATLQRRIAAAGDELALDAVALSEIQQFDPAPQTTAAPSHVVSVYGIDHPGIVHAVTHALAQRQWNITDLETRVLDETEVRPLYALVLEVSLTDGASTEDLRRAMESVGDEQGVEITARPLGERAEG